jgi:hypothetical protein
VLAECAVQPVAGGGSAVVRQPWPAGLAPAVARRLVAAVGDRVVLGAWTGFEGGGLGTVVSERLQFSSPAGKRLSAVLCKETMRVI